MLYNKCIINVFINVFINVYAVFLTLGLDFLVTMVS